MDSKISKPQLDKLGRPYPTSNFTLYHLTPSTSPPTSPAALGSFFQLLTFSFH